MAPNRQKKKSKKSSTQKKFRAADVEKTTSRGSVLSPTADPLLIAKWPKLRMKVPPLFLHQKESFEVFKENALDMAKSGVKFYYPRHVQFYIKFDFPTFDDHKSMAQFCERKKLPYHTYGFPNKRKMKVMITGLPKDTELNTIKEELKKLSIPVVRIHKLHTQDDNVRPMIVMVVVPHADDGRQIFKVKKILGHEVKLEPPKPKPRQCYRCQRWGHSQRYCHGAFKCVKCAGDHFYKHCTKNAKTPPKCANCGGAHTANYKECASCPLSEAYKRTMVQEIAWRSGMRHEKPLLSDELLKPDQTLTANIGKNKVHIQGPPVSLACLKDADDDDEEDPEYDDDCSDIYDMCPSDFDDVDENVILL